MNTRLLDKIIVTTILKPFYRHYDIEGAPFKIGNTVRILDNPNDDDTFNRKYSSRIGIVTYFEYDGGCCQTFPDDPMIGIKFRDGKIAEFWKEELDLFI